MELLVDALYTVSTALLIPVIVALLSGFAWSLWSIGGILGEWRDRRRQRKVWESFHRRLAVDEKGDASAFFERDDYPGLLGDFASRGRGVSNDSLRLNKLLVELELQSAARLATMSLGVRLGPMLGLMGTLIPMGPALLGLSQGAVDELATNLVVAFSTTVVGLFIGGVSYVMLLVRRHWYATDLSEAEFVCRCLSSTGEWANA